MKKNIAITFTILFLAGLVTADDKANQTEIYVCQASLTNVGPDKNPYGYQKLELSFFEGEEQVANRPIVWLEGTLQKLDETVNFSYSVLGVPEFLGANLFHSYFTGSYTSNTDHRPEAFLLNSPYEKKGVENAGATLHYLDNSAGGITGLGSEAKEILLRDIYLDCDVKSHSSIYLD